MEVYRPAVCEELETMKNVGKRHVLSQAGSSIRKPVVGLKTRAYWSGHIVALCPQRQREK